MTIFGYVEGTQGLDICTVDINTDDPNYEPQYQVSDIVNYLNIKDEVIDRMELAMQLFIKYKNEIDEVITLFKDNDIPADVYYSRFETPIGSSLQFFLAITLTHQNKKITNWSISRLKQELEKVDYEGYRNNPLGFYDYVHNMNVSDVYETLNEIKNLDSKEYDMSYLEFYKKVVTLQAKRSDIEYEREEYQANYLHYELLLNIILVTVQLIQRMLINIYIQKEVYKTYNVKNRIEASKFKEALKNVYMFEGLSEIEANIKVNESLKATDKINKKAFRNNAESYAYLDEILN